MPEIGTKRADPVKTMVNVGCLMDIPTGVYLEGMHGEMILNGGVGRLEAIVGAGNLGKSTLSHYRTITGCYRMGQYSSVIVFDTEISVQEYRVQQFIDRITNGEGSDWIVDGKWSLSDQDSIPGEEWFNKFKDYMHAKIEDKSIRVVTPFKDRPDKDGKVKALTIPMPTFCLIDSITNFKTKDTVDVRDKVTVGDSKANTLYMTQGRNNTRIINETHAYCGASSVFTTMTAHMVEKLNLDPYAPVQKQLPALKANLKIKAPNDFHFFTSNAWWVTGTSVMQDNDKFCMYPDSNSEEIKDDRDLNIITLTQLRSKSGGSAIQIHVILSQRDGILPSLTEYHFLKSNNYWGLPGNKQNHACALYQEVNLKRTTIRNQLESDKKLARAINITSEILQIARYVKCSPDLLCHAHELYEDIKNLGYDWDMILEKTRGWWTIEGEHKDLLFLSTLDLLRMRKGLYHPYWLEKDKKTIRKEYLS